MRRREGTKIDVAEEVWETAGEQPSLVARLYAEHAPAAVGFATLITRDKGFAEDLVQEAFIRCVGRHGALRDPAAFGGYLRRAVVNLFLSDRRRRKLERSYVERTGAMATAGPDDVFERGAIRDELHTALLDLPPRQRLAVVLRYYCDLPERDAARQMGCSSGALRSLVLRGMETLRSTLGGDDV